MKSLKSSRSSYVLLTLGVLFSLGAAVRFLPSSLATAEETEHAEKHPAEDDGHAPKGTSSLVTMPDMSKLDRVCFDSDIAALLAADQEKLAAQQEALQSLELDLLARQEKLDAREADLEAVRVTLEERWTMIQSASNEDMEHLARMYGTMKPAQAATIFNQMDSEFAAGFLRLMRSEAAGMIMAGMETDKAYAVSLKLASMNEDVRATAER